jgi:hypothetical protein
MKVRGPRPSWKVEPIPSNHVRSIPAHDLKAEFGDRGYAREYGVTPGAPIARTRSLATPIRGRCSH